MVNWKPLTIDNLVRAQCIFISEGNDFGEIKDPKFIAEKMGELWLHQYAKEAIQQLGAGEREYEFIFDVIGSERCRLYVYSAQSDSITRQKFPGSDYSLAVTPMNHIRGLPEEIDARFNRIKQALLDEGFPTDKY